MTPLFRPVGFHELALLWDLGMRAFPPRLAHQPIFYPVTNLEYATQIARDWNTRDEASGFAGFVTQFTVPEFYLSKFEPRTVGSSLHQEYWIPAEELSAFSDSIQGPIVVRAAYFGESFKGCVPQEFGLKDMSVVQQFIAMCKTWDYSRMDFVCEVSTNRKAMYLNFLFWAQFDFSDVGIEPPQRDVIIGKLAEAWEFNHIPVPLPATI